MGRHDLCLEFCADHLARGGGRGIRRPFRRVEQRAAEPIIPLGLFRISVFSVSNSVGFLVGFVMFGAIIYIPLYLQTVHAATPTSSGLQPLPLVCGMLVTFTISGRLVTKWGRYKIFPVLGTAA